MITSLFGNFYFDNCGDCNTTTRVKIQIYKEFYVSYPGKWNSTQLSGKGIGFPWGAVSKFYAHLSKFFFFLLLCGTNVTHISGWQKCLLKFFQNISSTERFSQIHRKDFKKYRKTWVACNPTQLNVKNWSSTKKNSVQSPVITK